MNEIIEFSDNVPVNTYPTPSHMPYEITEREFLGIISNANIFSRREKIEALQMSSLFYAAQNQLDHSGPKPVETFSAGIYCRTLTMPKDMVIVSKRHAREHIVFISKGCAIVYTEDGITKVVAPYQFVSPAGAKRALLIQEECTWTNFHKTNAQRIEDVEADLMMPEPHLTLEQAQLWLG